MGFPLDLLTLMAEEKVRVDDDHVEEITLVSRWECWAHAQLLCANWTTQDPGSLMLLFSKVTQSLST